MGYIAIKKLYKHIDRNTFSLLSRHAGLKRIFHITGFDQVITQCWQEDIEKYRKDHSVKSLFRSIISMNIFGMDSVDELHETLENNQGLRFSCGCLQGPASRSQMSRDINSMDLVMVTTVFDLLKQKAKQAGVYHHTGFSKKIKELKELIGRPVVSIDESFIRLSKGWFPFLKKGYCTLTGKQEYGIRINVGHCVTADATMGLTVTEGDVHETNSFEQLVTQSMKAGGTTKLIFVMDKGYYDHDRFQRFCDADVFFVTPRKKYSLKKAVLYPEEDKETWVDGKRVVDGFMIQGGGFYPDGTMKQGNDPIDLEIHPDARHVDGAIAMARTSNPDSATSQFFIDDGAQHSLEPGGVDPNGYAVFGVVTDGMEVVRSISAVGTTSRYGRQDWPVDDVVINRITIES